MKKLLTFIVSSALANSIQREAYELCIALR